MPEDSPSPASSPRASRPRSDLPPESGPVPADEFLSRVAGEIGRAADPRKAAEAFLIQLERLIPGARAGIALLEPATGRASWMPPDRPGLLPLGLARTPAGLLFNALQCAHPSVVHDVASLIEVPEKPHLQERGGAWAFLPVPASGRVVGALVVRAPGASGLSKESVGSLGRGLPVLGLALRSALFDQEIEAALDRGARELSILFDVSRELSSVRTPEELLLMLSRALHSTLPVELCALTLLPPRTGEICVMAGQAVPEEAIASLARGALLEVERLAGRPVEVSLRVTRHHEPAPAGAGTGGLRSAAHAPLHLRHEVVGLLSIGSCARGGIGRVEQRLLRAIAQQASLTVQRLQATEDAESTRIRSVLQSMADGVLMLNKDLDLLMTNPAAQQHLVSLTGEAMPARLTRLGEVDLAPLMGHFAHRDVERFEVTASNHRTFVVKCSPVRGTRGIEGLVIAMSDVTESRKVQIQLAQSERLTALGQMLSGVAHELNNPLASLTLLAEALERVDLSPAVREKVERMGIEASRCGRIVRHLLSFARRQSPEWGTVSLNEAIGSVLQLLGDLMESEGIEWTGNLADDLRPIVGDYHEVQQVFFNLVRNAWQAMGTVDLPGRLVLTTRNEDGMVVAEVSDNGPGIPESDLGRIFDPFFTTKRDGEGTGLGLSIAWDTVERHGGRIAALTRPGGGTTFRVEFPAAPRGVEISGTTGRAEERPGGEVTADPVAGGQRILIVDDEKPLLDVVAELLEGCGHVVDKAPDGESARRCIEKNDYDLIISDMKMPNMGGRELYRHVERVSPDLASRIIFSTGDSANPDTLSFFEEVGNPFLTKPFKLDRLLAVVESALKRR